MSTDTTKERADRATELELIDTIKDLQVEADKVNLVIKPGTSKADARKLILDAQFGLEGGTGVAGDTQGTEGADKDPDASKADKKAKKEEDQEDVDPLVAKQLELDEELGVLYDGICEQIKAVAVDGTKGESAEQMRAGAVQFLRQANATVGEARQLLENAKKVNEDNNKQRQSIEKAKADLEKRSQDYRAMTSGGEKNA